MFNQKSYLQLKNLNFILLVVANLSYTFRQQPTKIIIHQLYNRIIMSSSPYVPADIKQYIRKSQIQDFVNRAINDLLKQRPEDPYSYLIGEFQKKATSEIQIQNIVLSETISGQGFPTIKVKAIVKFMNKEKIFYLQQPFGILSQQNNMFDADGVGQKGQKKAIAYYKQKIQCKILNKGNKCSDQDLIDSELVKSYKENQQKSVYVVNSISFSIPAIKAMVLSKPLYQIYAQLADNQLIQKKISPRLIVNCLHGGKAIGSKCKVFKYYIIGQNIKNPYLAQTVLQNIKKTICSGKGGEAALKYSPDGTFICPLDTIMDNLKIIQDAINSSNAKEQFSIGLSWLADTFYSVDTKKYQLQNPKTPFDNDQMIDYLVKLLTDKPIISYLEDPLAPTQLPYWKKLINKIKSTESIKNVKIGSRSGKLLDLMSQNFKQTLNQLSLAVTEDSHPDLSKEQRQTKNSQKIILDMIQIRAFQSLTVTNLIKAHKQLKKAKTCLIIQDNSFQSYNTDLIDICHGFRCYASLGSIFKFDRVSKLNRIRQILDQAQA